jgi:4-amino-4-deoxychorismate lyase
MLAALINGEDVTNAAKAIHIEDRGLSYGDGLFETMLVKDGEVRLLERHLSRLKLGCERLKFVCPEAQVRADIAKLTRVQKTAVLKIIVTRGAGGRGYRSADLDPTRIAILYDAPAQEAAANEIKVRWCQTRLARNPQLAGLKHLNRIEQVLAQNEWHDASIAEGLMLDTEGELVCATASNLFAVIDGVLVTPDLRYSGIHGVMRAHVIVKAQHAGIAVEERPLRPEEFLLASEVFLTNAVRGIRSVVQLEEQNWRVGLMTTALLGLV